MKTWLGSSWILISVLAQSAAYAAGGVGSGGGETLASERVGLDQIAQAIQSSRNLVTAFLNHAEREMILGSANPRPDPLPKAYSLFFSGSESVFDVLNLVRVEILRDAPCISSDGNPYDGSVLSGVPHGICMSASRMLKKLTFANYRAEVAALMLHEISHLVGSTEEQAVEIQKVALQYFAHTDTAAIYDWNFRVIDLLELFSNTLDMTTALLETRAPISCNHLQRVMGQSFSVFHQLTDAGTRMSLTRERNIEYFRQSAIRLSAIADSLCTQPGYGNDSDRSSYGKRIETLFGDRTRITASEYAGDLDPKYNRYPLVTVWIPRYRSIDEARRELHLTWKDVVQLRVELIMQWNLQFPSLKDAQITTRPRI